MTTPLPPASAPESDSDAFAERLLEGFHAEIENPTDEPEGEITQ